MTLLALAVGAIAGLLLTPLGRWREKTQQQHLAAFEQKVADACRQHPGLAWTARLEEEHFLTSEPPECRTPPPGGTRPPRRAARLVAAFLEEVRERGEDAFYSPGASSPREASAIAAAVGAVGFMAAARHSGETLVVVAVLALAVTAVLLTYVDCRTYLIDLPIAGIGATAVVGALAAAEWRADGTLSRTAGALLAAAAAAAVYSALGSVALMARRARTGGSLARPALAFLAVTCSLAAPYLVALRSMLVAPAPVALWAASTLPLAASAYIGRRLTESGTIVYDREGRMRIADGPAVGVGDGDLLMMPLVVTAPVMLVGAAVLPLLLLLPAVLALLGMLARAALGRGGSRSPLPFAPALLASALIAIAAADLVPGWPL